MARKSTTHTEQELPGLSLGRDELEEGSLSRTFTHQPVSDQSSDEAEGELTQPSPMWDTAMDAEEDSDFESPTDLGISPLTTSYGSTAFGRDATRPRVDFLVPKTNPSSMSRAKQTTSKTAPPFSSVKGMTPPFPFNLFEKEVGI